MNMEKSAILPALMALILLVQARQTYAWGGTLFKDVPV
jgi:hypothetical protein